MIPDEHTGASEAATAASIDLVRRAQDGDLGAFNRLFARYYDRVRRVVRLRLGPGLRGVLESGDILQETFVAAVQAFEHFEVREEAGLIDWLSRIAERRIKVAARHARALKRDRRREVAIDHIRGSITSGEIAIEPAATITLPGEKAMKAEAIELLEEGIAELKEEYREVILQREYCGASWETIAHQMQSPSANASRMLHARAMVELGKRVRRRRD